ncbi:glycine cleavage system protein H [Bifidobacterium primatium]|uniref:Glycine cleavage system H protein n=1 Tax=Bifidobacterium primatium TaxID=2045438 RepID=A0A2M9HAV4_9BIFI|nr:glycine cleavage system protein GcvH [Bifidobacterium primatium]PJM73940.1 glycine cleavage system protein H [Bifidobacterium primatium]
MTDEQRYDHELAAAASSIEVPEHLKYSDDHVWLDDSVDPVVIGITEHAAEELGDLVFIDFPEPGTRVEAGDEIVSLESSKAVSPVISPVAGEVKYVNREAYDDPSVVDSDPYGEGWLLKIALDDDEPDMMDAEEYAALLRK